MLIIRRGKPSAKRLTNTLLSPACNGTIVNDTEMGEVIQLQGDQRKDVQEFLVDKKEGLELDAKTIKVPTKGWNFLVFQLELTDT